MMSRKFLGDVTLCLTMGGRPDLLRTSLESLAEKWKFQKIIAVNDFSDPLCDAVFKEIFPDGVLLSDQKKRGHHGAIDWLYESIDTEFVLHTEDDWVFFDGIDLGSIQRLLRQEHLALSYCFRSVKDFLSKEIQDGIQEVEKSKVKYFNISGVHPEWYSYTFNPHLIKTENIRKIGKFSVYKKERHVSRAMKSQGFFVAYAAEPLCTHIGDGQSVANPWANKKKPTMKLWIEKVINGLKK